MNRIEQIQKSLKKHGMDGWLFYSFRHSDPFASRILRFSEGGHATRRWFYFIPAVGEPVKILHAIEKNKLSELEGNKIVYLSWQSLHEAIERALGQNITIAMQYSPMNDIPYISCVDAGTVELVKAMGKNVVSSAELIQEFESILTSEQTEQHKKACILLRRFVDITFSYVAEKVKNGSSVSEYDVQQFMLKLFEENNLTTADPPVAAVNENSANPHYDPKKDGCKLIKKGDFLLIDLWAKLKEPGAVYGDITWTGYIGDEIPDKYSNIFSIAANARDAAFEFIKQRMTEGRTIRGFEVDDAARNVIKLSGYSDSFIHRTGHSIGEEVHGTGVMIDNLETKDVRTIVPGCCFSLEPGIYLEGDFGVRTEIDVYVGETGPVCFSEPIQKSIVKII